MASAPAWLTSVYGARIGATGIPAVKSRARSELEQLPLSAVLRLPKRTMSKVPAAVPGNG